MLARLLFSSPPRGRAVAESSAKPGWLRRQVTAVLELLSRRACTHPIHTLVFVALLASTTYINLLEGGVFWKNSSEPGPAPSRTHWSSFLQGSKDLCVGEHTAWKWRAEDSNQCLNTKRVMCFPCSCRCRVVFLLVGFEYSPANWCYHMSPASCPSDPCVPRLSFRESGEFAASSGYDSHSCQFFSPGPSIYFEFDISHISRLDSRLLSTVFRCRILSVNTARVAGWRPSSWVRRRGRSGRCAPISAGKGVGDEGGRGHERC